MEQTPIQEEIPLKQYRLGDLVRKLHSKRKMLVLEIEENGWVECSWFDDEKNYVRSHFLPEVLELVEL